MDISLWGIASILLVLKGGATAEHQEDILEWYRPSHNNPPELNSFITNVWRHKNDFNLIDNLVRNSPKSKKSPKISNSQYIKDWDLNMDGGEDQSEFQSLNNDRYTRRVGGTAQKKRKPTHRIRRTLFNKVVVKPRSNTGILDTNQEMSPYEKVIKHRNEYDNHYDDYDRVPSFQLDNLEDQSAENYFSNNLNNEYPPASRKLNKGFIEVVRNRPKTSERPQIDNNNMYNNVYDDEMFGKVNPLKHRIRKRKKLQNARLGRRLQFYGDDSMYYEEDDYQTRSRRDFLEALGMSNEDDYTEDNSYLQRSTTSNVSTTTVTTADKRSSPADISSTTVSTMPDDNEDKEKNDDEDKDKNDEGEDKTVPLSPDLQSIIPIKKRDQIDLEVEDFGDVEENREQRDIFDDMDTHGNTSTPQEPKLDMSPGFMKSLGLDSLKPWNKVPTEKGHRRRRRRKKKKKHTHLDRQKKEDTLDFPASSTSLYLETYTLSSEDPNAVLATMTDGTFATFNVNAGITNENTSLATVEEDKANNLPNEDNEHLARIIDGEIAHNVVNSVLDQVKSIPTLKKEIFPVLVRKHPNYQGAVNFEIIRANDTSDEVLEAKILLKQMSQVLNKVIWTQVNKKLCQRLPHELHNFLTTITDIDGDVDLENQVEINTEQGDFLFQGPPVPRGLGSYNQNDLKSTLEDLLRQFDQMNAECQNKAQPIKDYIMQHLKMLDHVGLFCSSGKCGVQEETKRETPLVYRSDLIEQQLESLGLGRKHNFRPNFDINEIVQSRLEPNGILHRRSSDHDRNLNLDNILNSDVEPMKLKREIPNEESEKYRRLQRAVEQLRQKKNTDERIARLFGENNQDKSDMETPLVYSSLA